jgi:hypothetical protein
LRWSRKYTFRSGTIVLLHRDHSASLGRAEQATAFVKP